MSVHVINLGKEVGFAIPTVVLEHTPMSFILSFVWLNYALQIEYAEEERD